MSKFVQIEEINSLRRLHYHMWNMNTSVSLQACKDIESVLGHLCVLGNTSKFYVDVKSDIRLD